MIRGGASPTTHAHTLLTLVGVPSPLLQIFTVGADNPEFRLVTDDIEEVYKKVKSKYPELLHPNLSEITLRPWGAKEFALMDEQIGIITQQW